MTNHRRQMYLFERSTYVQRPIPEQRKFEIDYFRLLATMPKIIMQAFDLTSKARRKKRPMSMNRNWFANELSGNVLDLAAQSFPHFVQRTGRGNHCLVLNYKYECYMKKLKPKTLFPLYNHTKASKRLTNQEALPTQEPLPIIYIGWTLNRTNEMITGYYAVCIKGDERLWVSDLTAIAKPKRLEVASSKQQSQDGSPLVTIKPKEKRKRK